MDGIELYRSMARQRAVEMALAELWHRGRAPGEMHLGTGEEALVAGVVAHREEGDAFAIDHRASTVLTALGVPPRAILAECIGREDGLCRGRGGHMHLFDPGRLAASSGIVGSSGPMAAGFALAARHLRRGAIAVAFFGDGAANQGMLLESWNLAAAWSLPVIFVCKDNGWAVVTRTRTVTGGELRDRARGFGLETREVDGTDAPAVYDAVAPLVARARAGDGPGFLLARVPRLDGHYLGDALVRMAHRPTDGMDTSRALIGGLFGRGGGGVADRAKSLGTMLGLMMDARGEHRGDRHDPLSRARKQLGSKHRDALDAIDAEALAEVQAALDTIDEGGAS